MALGDKQSGVWTVSPPAFITLRGHDISTLSYSNHIEHTLRVKDTLTTVLLRHTSYKMNFRNQIWSSYPIVAIIYRRTSLTVKLFTIDANEATAVPKRFHALIACDGIHAKKTFPTLFSPLYIWNVLLLSQTCSLHASTATVAPIF